MQRKEFLPGTDAAGVAGGDGPKRARRRRRALGHVLVGMGCIATAAPALAENWRSSASASATETYTTNANYSARDLAEGDFATTLTATLNVHGEGARVKLHGSIGATGLFYVTETQNNSIAPTANIGGTVEAIENFAFVDAQALVTQTFLSPFGPQPANLVNATQNRYTQQTYAVSPYIRGVLPSTKISYQLRDDSYWTVASDFGNSSLSVPTTYSNALHGAMESPAAPWGWSLVYDRYYYDNGIAAGSIAGVGQGTYTTQQIRLLVPYQIDPQVQIGGRIGYEGNQFPVQDTTGTIYGVSFQWTPTPRTNVGGFWEHRFFGSSYSVQASHRLPNAALTANAARGLNSYPQLALAIPAGAAVSQFVDAAFTTRIPDPAERAQAVEQFLAQTGLPPTLASPVDFYAASLTLQDSANVSLVLIGTRNSVGMSVFYLKSQAISGAGSVLPPALQFGQNNTQTGAGVNFSHRLSAFTNVAANANYSTTRVDTSTGPFADARTNNASAGVSLNTRFGPRTTGSAGVSYSWSETPGSAFAGNTSALNVFVTINHTFY